MAEVEVQIQTQHLVEHHDKFEEISDKFNKTLTLQPELSSSLASTSSSNPINGEEQRKPENEDETITLQPSTSTANQIDENGEEDEEENGEFEFCFFSEALNSPVSAEEVFEDGQIRIISPFSCEPSNSGDRESSSSSFKPPVKKLFVVSSSSENDDAEEGAYCVWESPSPEMSKKSNSTGFSKLWKVRELLSRSNSDGKDAYVFLKNDDTNTNTTSSSKKKNKLKLEKIDVGKRVETTTYEKKESNHSSSSSSSTSSKNKKKKSAYEVFYGGDKQKKGGGGGKSYLPYRQDLVGFFTNGSGMSRNVHPY